MSTLLRVIIVDDELPLVMDFASGCGERPTS